MNVEREMSAVESHVAPKKFLEHAAPATADRLQPSPEKPVMYNQQNNPALDRGLDGANRSIDRRANLRHGPGILHLQAVQRIFPIFDFGNTKMLVRVGN